MSAQGQFTENTLIDLGTGSQIALFAFRACALNQTECGCALKTMQHFFGDQDGPDFLDLVSDLAVAIARSGRRRVQLGAPGCISVTLDEASIISALSAAQTDDFELCSGHLYWLLAARPDNKISRLVHSIADTLASREFEVRAPDQHMSIDANQTAIQLVSGHA